MLNILLFDSSFFNNQVLRQDTKTYFEQNNLEYNYFEATSLAQAIDILQSNSIDIMYIDISSKKFDGIEVLKEIKELDIFQPKIIAVTVLFDKKYRFEALKLKVYRYIYKPYDHKEIAISLDKFFQDNISLLKKKEIVEDDFQEEIGFDEFDDFDSFDDEEIDHDKELMDIYNQSHKKVSADEFLSLYDESVYSGEDLEDLEDELDRLVANLLFNDAIDEEKVEIVNIFRKYSTFLVPFSEFEELSNVLQSLYQLVDNTDFSKIERKQMASKFIVAILQDLVEWKEHLFILKDAVDVYYINASILNSYIQLKDLLK